MASQTRPLADSPPMIREDLRDVQANFISGFRFSISASQ
jgi:hypothetical protein